MDRTSVLLMMSAGRLVVFLLALRLALGPLLPFPPSQNFTNSVFWERTSEPERPWVPRARASDARRISGHITGTPGTPGTLEVASSVHTGLRFSEGRITLTPHGGPSMTLKAGDSLALHPGFSGNPLP